MITATLFSADMTEQNLVTADDMDALRRKIEVHLVPALEPGDRIEIGDDDGEGRL